MITESRGEEGGSGEEEVGVCRLVQGIADTAAIMVSIVAYCVVNVEC